MLATAAVLTILAPVPAVPSCRSDDATDNVREVNPTVDPPLNATLSLNVASL